MKQFFIFVLFVSAVVCMVGIVRTRSGIIESGQKINQLQKELWRLRDLNNKLKNEYRGLVTPENILKKNRELCLTLIPPQEVICLKREKSVVSMDNGKSEGNGD